MREEEGQFSKEIGYSRSFVIVTDGYVNVELECLKYISTNLNNANFFAFGIGSSVNRYLIESIAFSGRSRPFIATSSEEAARVASQMKEYISKPLLSDISIKGKYVELYEVVPESIPDLMAERPIYFFGKYIPDDNARISITGQVNGERFYKDLKLPKPSPKNSQLSFLWAREKLRFLSDFNHLKAEESTKMEIIRLGLKYNLLTEFTSFVAIDTMVVNHGEQLMPRRQTLPMPQHVSNRAIGFTMNLEDLSSSSCGNINIQVHSSDKSMNMLVDAILENIFKTELSVMELESMIGTCHELKIVKGLVKIKNGNELLERIVVSINAALEILSIGLEDEFTFSFEVTSL